ncbi:HPr family phosphocarrier protein [Bacillus daqingensis]|uniref:HPr family phosphocarrier protein n=1 Tax=Bacillus daqingensis TaxID=872396 RepID=A0ABV9NXX9_9BACI
MKLIVKKPVFGETASTFVNRLGEYEDTVLIRKDHWVIDAKSLLGVLAVSLQPGDEIELDFSGEPDQQAIQQFKDQGIFE